MLTGKNENKCRLLVELSIYFYWYILKNKHIGYLVATVFLFKWQDNINNDIATNKINSRGYHI